jgi:Zn-dependent metalloprotease
MTCCFVIPPHILSEMARSPNARVRAAAISTMNGTAFLRGHRDILGRVQQLQEAMPQETKLAYDARGWTYLPGNLVWREGMKQSGYQEVDEAMNGAHTTYELLQKAFGWSSLNGQNMRMLSTVRYGKSYNNAFWQGSQMVYGSGDGYVFNRFTAAIDVCGHELAHGVTQFTCALEYQGQSGALNEHFSDVIGSMVKQWALGQTVEQADWLIGAGLFTQNIRAQALRNMLNPGTAYNDPNVGRDPQPVHMSNLYRGQADGGGVHINSGIPNRAFALAATAIGGKAWEEGGAGQIWWRAHTQGGVQPFCDFVTYAKITVKKAQELSGTQSKTVDAVQNAWAFVGVL